MQSRFLRGGKSDRGLFDFPQDAKPSRVRFEVSQVSKTGRHGAPFVCGLGRKGNNKNKRTSPRVRGAGLEARATAGLHPTDDRPVRGDPGLETGATATALRRLEVLALLGGGEDVVFAREPDVEGG